MMIIPFHDDFHVAPGDTVERSVHLKSDQAGTLRYLRIYERLQATSTTNSTVQVGGTVPHETWEVVKDALIDGREDAAQELVAGALGPWRPSMILIHRFQDYGRDGRFLLENVMAHAAWNLDLNLALDPHHALGLEVKNEENYERTLRVNLVVDNATFDSAVYTAARGLFGSRIEAIETAVRQLSQRSRRPPDDIT